MGKERTRTRASSIVTTLPCCTCSSSEERLASRSATCHFLPQGQESPKVGVRREKDAAFQRGSLENLLVRSFLKPIVPHVNRVVPKLPKLFRNRR